MTDIRVLFHYEVGPALHRNLEALKPDGLDVVTCPESDDDMARALIAEAEVLWHVLRPVKADMIAAAPRLKLIQKIGIGVNTIDLDAARDHDIAVCNMPGTNSRAVAELVIGLMLTLLRHVRTFDAEIRRGVGWAWPPARQDDLGEIGGRIVGLVGYGAVPRRLAPVLKALGATILYTDVAPVADPPGEYCELPSLLARSDIVSLHVPLTARTESMIDADAIARMKPGAILINTARGELVDEGALTAALRDRRLGAAGLDTFAREPIAPDNPLLGLDNVVVTPHIAWLTSETLKRSLEVAVDNTMRLAAGRTLRHRIV
ncbi:MAG: 2-hydroxyacid dehydrogenase [Alphaproteobacteria bacterium]|jgi:phosphoglycerate dehydrogenase-like enzyme|nr:2-hydroxyacid dehydrogenase [Alphaproteobacteria bacterium]MDP6515189.1 2-hydroxyacid dehydrogenase [Alphaproteobacteria bacterium]